MNSLSFIGIPLILAGAYCVYSGLKAIRNPAHAEKAFTSNPRMAITQQMLGKQKSIHLWRRIFAPLYVVLGAILIFVGIAFLFNL
jgi:hypothetical protein